MSCHDPHRILDAWSTAGLKNLSLIVGGSEVIPKLSSSTSNV